MTEQVVADIGATSERGWSRRAEQRIETSSHVRVGCGQGCQSLDDLLRPFEVTSYVELLRRPGQCLDSLDRCIEPTLVTCDPRGERNPSPTTWPLNQFGVDGEHPVEGRLDPVRVVSACVVDGTAMQGVARVDQQNREASQRTNPRRQGMT